MEQSFIYIVYMSIGWVILPTIYFIAIASEKAEESIGLNKQSKILGRIFVIITLFSLIFVVVPYFGELGEIAVYYEDMLLSSVHTIDSKIKSRWLFIGLFTNIAFMGIALKLKEKRRRRGRKG